MGEYGEPWSSVNDKQVDAIIVRDARGSYICETFDTGDDATMDRIWACVNALDGVPDEAMPMVKKLVELARTKSDKLADAYKQLMQVMVDNAIREVPHVDT